MKSIDVTLINEQDGSVWPAEVVLDQPLGWWIDQLLAEMNLPRQKGKRTFHYRLVRQKSGKMIREDQTLQSAGIKKGETLRLEQDPDFSARTAPAKNVRRGSFIWKLLAFIGPLALTIFIISTKNTIRFDFLKREKSAAVPIPTPSTIPTEMPAKDTTTASPEVTSTPSMPPSPSPTEPIASITPAASPDSTAGIPALDSDDPTTWPIIASDSFDQPSNDWPQGNIEQPNKISMDITTKDGVYQIDAHAEDQMNFVLPNFSGYPQNAYYSVDIRLVDTPPGRFFGLVFHHLDFSDFGGFGISSDGKMFAFFVMNTEYSAAIQKTPSEFIQPNGFNTLSLLIDGDTYHYFINGNLVGQVTEPRSTGPRCGFYIDLGTDENGLVEFDNFLIRSREPLVE